MSGLIRSSRLVPVSSGCNILFVSRATKLPALVVTLLIIYLVTNHLLQNNKKPAVTGLNAQTSDYLLTKNEPRVQLLNDRELTVTVL